MTGSCVDESAALAFVEGELAEDARGAIESHIDDCDSCRQILAELVRGEDSTAWSPGRRVGRYVIRERIGRGGMGAVFRADDVELGRAVALKRLHANADADARARLVREARAAAQLSHPNVVTVYEVGDDAGGAFLAMELVDGLTLTRWLREQPRPWQAIVAVMAQAGRGLAAAHAGGVVHRDFKPDNVLIDHVAGSEAPRARVVDFGLARSTNALGPRLAGSDRLDLAAGTPGPFSQPGKLAGTPAYLAPELLAGAPPDARSDQYAFAVSLFVAVHGEYPFEGSSSAELWSAMAAGRVRRGRGAAPAWIDRAIRRGLAVDPAARWPSMAAFTTAIAPRRRRWPGFVAAAVALAAIVVAVATRQRSAPDTCAEGTALVDGLWNPAIRAAQTGRFIAAAPLRTTTIATTTAMLDDWVAAWRLGRTAACSIEPERRAARLGCLDRDLAVLRAQLAVWATVDRDAVDHAVRVAGTLPRPDDCANHAPPVGASTPELEARIADLKAGTDRQGAPKVAGVLTAAEATRDPGTLARALAIATVIETATGELDPARVHAARAAREAARAGDDLQMLAALVLESNVALAQGRPAEALELCSQADATIARTKLERSAQVDIARANALVALGRLPEAVAAYQRAIAYLEPRAARDRRDRIWLASAYGSLGATQGVQARFEDARASLSRGLAIEETELGDDHPGLGRTLHDLANQEVSLGRFADAQAHFERARAIFVGSFGEHSRLVGATDIALGNLLAVTRHGCTDARVLWQRAADELAGTVPADDPALAGLEESFAGCARDEGRYPDELQHIARAVELSEHRGVAAGQLGIELVNYGSAFINVGRFADARTQLERGLAELDRGGVVPEGHCDAWRLLAEIEAHDGHKAKAIALLRQTLAALGDDPRPDAAAARDDTKARLAELSP